MIQAIVIDKDYKQVGKSITGASIESIFRTAQFCYGHCLGKIVNETDNELPAWRFAKCSGSSVCSSVLVVNIVVVGEESRDQEGQ